MSIPSASTPAAPTRLTSALATIVGDGHVLLEPDLRAPYERDFTGRYAGEAAAVVRPGAASEVAAVLVTCAEHGARVVPQGGNTGVVGGGVPRAGEVVVSLSRLTELGDVDPVSGHLLAGAGVALANVQAAALRAGWEMPLDLGARDGATIGGLVASDAGGAMALAHGTMRQRVAGLAAVLPSGQAVERLSGLHKDNAGYAWPAIMIGSEGTLGVITSVLLRLIPRRAARVAALFSVPGTEEAMQLLITLRRLVPSLEAADVFFDEGVSLVERTIDGARLPLGRRSPCYVVVECAGAVDPTPELAEGVGAAEDLILDQAAAVDTAGRRAIWQVREALPEALVRAGLPVKVDIAVPLGAVPRFTSEVRRVIEATAPGAETVLWGHLGDGNVHVNVLGAEDRADAVEERVLRLAAELGGTVSAEHGVGVSNAHHLELVRSAAELQLLRTIKTALDPTGTMNPGVVLPTAH
jgi:FAD/FMN-containing dehydrogenase